MRGSMVAVTVAAAAGGQRERSAAAGLGGDASRGEVAPCPTRLLWGAAGRRDPTARGGRVTGEAPGGEPGR